MKLTVDLEDNVLFVVLSLSSLFVARFTALYYTEIYTGA